MTDYDVIVIGAGQPAPGLVAQLAGGGRRVALIEMDRVGGTCLNHGCRPTKALRSSSVVAARARRAAEYGVHTGEVTVDYAAAIRRVHLMIDGMRDGVQRYLTGIDGADLLTGTARLRTRPDGPHEVAVGAETHRAPEVILNVGSRAAVPNLPGLDGVPYLTEVELLALTDLPEHLLVMGGGYVGLEFGQMYRRFGSDVTILADPGVAPHEDEDVSAGIVEFLVAEGVRVVHDRAAAVEPEGAGMVVVTGGGERIPGSHLLLAVGRRPNLDLLGDRHGLDTDERGFVRIGPRFETSVPGVRALGDINGHGAFTHTAYQDGQILTDPARTVTGRITAYAVFVDPPLGRVGMTATQARASGRRVLRAEVAMSDVSRAVLDGETRGLMRILVDADTEEFLGATVLGLHGDEVVQLIGLAMQAGVRYPVLRDALPIHPTVSEFVPTLLATLAPLD